MLLSTISNATVDSDYSNSVFSTELVDKGTKAMGFTTQDIISGKTISFSNLKGKVILIDFFATWCGPCKSAMPYLRNINDYYQGNNNFQLVSIDVWEDVSDQTLKDFASQYDMNWYIFRDTFGLDGYYDVNAIPSLFILNQHQYVYFAEEGFGGEEKLKGIINDLLAYEDTEDPELNDFSCNLDTISVADNKFSVSMDISDNKELRYLKYKLTIGDYIEIEEYLTPDEGTHTFDFDIDSLVIWSAVQNGTTTATVDATVSDFTDNSVTEQLILNIIEIPDNEDPIISDISASEQLTTTVGYDVTINATITDDTAIKSAKAEIWINDQLNASGTMEYIGEDIFSVKLKKVKVELKQKITIKIIAEDLEGNIITTTKSHKVTGDADLGLLTSISIFVLSMLIVSPIMRKKKRQ